MLEGLAVASGYCPVVHNLSHCRGDTTCVAVTALVLWTLDVVGISLVPGAFHQVRNVLFWSPEAAALFGKERTAVAREGFASKDGVGSGHVRGFGSWLIAMLDGPLDFQLVAMKPCAHVVGYLVFVERARVAIAKDGHSHIVAGSNDKAFAVVGVKHVVIGLVGRDLCTNPTRSLVHRRGVQRS